MFSFQCRLPRLRRGVLSRTQHNGTCLSEIVNEMDTLLHMYPRIHTCMSCLSVYTKVYAFALTQTHTHSHTHTCHTTSSCRWLGSQVRCDGCSSSRSHRSLWQLSTLCSAVCAVLLPCVSTSLLHSRLSGRIHRESLCTLRAPSHY